MAKMLDEIAKLILRMSIPMQVWGQPDNLIIMTDGGKAIAVATYGDVEIVMEANENGLDIGGSYDGEDLDDVVGKIAIFGNVRYDLVERKVVEGEN